jgi:hypothetical protein
MTLFLGDNNEEEILASFSRPDLVHFLRACMWNDKLHSNTPRNEVDLNDRVQDAMSPISPSQLRPAINLFFKCDACLRARGKHFQHLL